MAVLRTTTTVRFGGFTAALCQILTSLEQVARSLDTPQTVTITAGSDGEHTTHSKHYSFNAVDVRTKNFPDLDRKWAFVEQVQAALPAGKFSVIFESIGKAHEHAHVQLKKGQSFPS